ncbi:MAG: hypothetical protein KIT79_11980 [Deltaproteobacteria bacterium]|nr:hypothetical protein [Deltaproteobacteria bacterium]
MSISTTAAKAARKVDEAIVPAPARLTVIGHGDAEGRARMAVAHLLRESAGRRPMIVAFFTSEKFRRAFAAEFQRVTGGEGRLLMENARSRRIRDLEGVARRAWLYGRLGATGIVAETGRDETAANVIVQLGPVVGRHHVPVTVVPGEALDAEFANSWRVAYLCRQAESHAATGFSAEQVERIRPGTELPHRPEGTALAPACEQIADGITHLLAVGFDTPQLGLGF